MFDNDTASYYTSGFAQKAGDWIGVDLGSVREVNEVSILQGRNSVDDVDYFDHAVLEYSADGKTWTPMIDDMNQQYVINWKDKDNAVKARYIRLKRLESKRTNYASVRSFDVNPLRLDNVGFNIEATNSEEALRAFDQRLNTSYKNTGKLTFEVTPETKGYTLLMNRPSAPVKLSFWKADGTMASEMTIDTPFFRVGLNDGITKVQIDGTVEIFEIIADK